MILRVCPDTRISETPTSALSLTKLAVSRQTPRSGNPNFDFFGVFSGFLGFFC